MNFSNNRQKGSTDFPLRIFFWKSQKKLKVSEYGEDGGDVSIVVSEDDGAGDESVDDE